MTCKMAELIGAPFGGEDSGARDNFRGRCVLMLALLYPFVNVNFMICSVYMLDYAVG